MRRWSGGEKENEIRVLQHGSWVCMHTFDNSAVVTHVADEGGTVAPNARRKSSGGMRGCF